MAILIRQLREEVYRLVCLPQLVRKSLVLLFQLINYARFRVIVPDRLVGDVACLTCVLHGRKIFVDLRVTRIQASDHETEAVAAERLAEETGQLGVTVRNVSRAVVASARRLFLIRQRGDDLPEREQTFVDVDRLFVDGAGLSLPLGARKVDQLQLRDDDVVEVPDVHLLDREAEHRVAAATAVVHVVAGDNFIADSKLVESHHVIGGLALESVEIFDGEHIILIPFELEAGPIIDR